MNNSYINHLIKLKRKIFPYNPIKGIIRNKKNAEIRKIIKNNSKKINTVFDLLYDKKSKELYLHYLKSRKTWMNKIPKELVEPYQNQYFDQEIIKLGDNEIFIDAGALDGATTKIFIEKINSPNYKAYLFEPDSGMYKIMCEKMASISVNNIICFEAGISSKSGIEKFSLSTPGGSRLDEKGTETVKIVTLDEEVNAATYIKMDIEGAELKALMGAQKLIKNSKPKLAICIYHKLEDLWEIPLFIHKLNPDYKLYIRQYEGAYYMDELVCYAIID